MVCPYYHNDGSMRCNISYAVQERDDWRANTCLSEYWYRCYNYTEASYEKKKQCVLRTDPNLK